jgi:hypothetical protein
VGNVDGFGVILHIAAKSPVDFSNALAKFAQVPGVTELSTLAWIIHEESAKKRKES